VAPTWPQHANPRSRARGNRAWVPWLEYEPSGLRRGPNGLAGGRHDLRARGPPAPDAPGPRRAEANALPEAASPIRWRWDRCSWWASRSPHAGPGRPERRAPDGPSRLWSDGARARWPLAHHPGVLSLLVPANGLRFSCGPQPAATRMNLFRWFHARQLQAPG
jgi:hypothetical protein